MIRKIIAFAVCSVTLGSGSLWATENISLEPSADATLYEGDGSLANGSGSYFFVGRTEDRNGAVERRAVLAFDVAGSVPAGATITAASLDVTMSRTISGGQTVQLRRVTESWNEGPSDASDQEGGGATSQNGDATWVHREFPNSSWASAGGSFSPTVSGSQQIAGTGPYTFVSTTQMVADVQAWLDDGATNFGWAIVMPSPGTGSAKQFRSRESSSMGSRPMLNVTYETDDEPELLNRLVFPASNAGGSGDSFFVTTADILNAGSTTATVRLALLPRNTDNSDALESALFNLEPGEVRRFDNVLGEAFGAAGEGIAGGAAVLSDSIDLLVMTRTFNQVDEGTIGAALPGIPDSELVQAGQRVTVLFLTENSLFRSNLGLINGVGIPITVQWQLFDSDGVTLGGGSRGLDSYGVTQINRVMRPFRPITAGYAEVWTDTSGGAFTTYGSILDEGTSDPTLVVPR